MSGLDIFMQILSYLGAVGIAIFSCPELIKSFKTKKTSGINIYLFILLMVSSACFFITGFYNVSKDLNAGKGIGDIAFSLAVAIANVFSFIVPFTLMIYKGIHVLKAKKLGLTEKQYEELLEKKIKNA